MRLASRAAVELPMKPTRGIFLPCCARAASGHVATTPPRSATNFRRLMEASPPAQTPSELRLSHSRVTPVVHYIKLVVQCQMGQKVKYAGQIQCVYFTLVRSTG